LQKIGLAETFLRRIYRESGVWRISYERTLR
jgi:hypothetical protein